MRKTAEDIGRELREWRRAHPTASLSEIDAEVERRYRELLTETVEELAHQEQGTEEACPHCQHPMQRRGQQVRTVQGRGGKTIALQRAYYTCPACGTGLFPPG
jgi:predicted RNA-binding Zn-ribbon protein involved in translation (DUF1610 family)